MKRTFIKLMVLAVPLVIFSLSSSLAKEQTAGEMAQELGNLDNKA